MRWMALAACVAMVATLLAGCSQSPPANKSPALELPEVTVDANSHLGGIAGVVVDEAIRPIANATVRVQGQGGNMTTGADGTFVVKDLEPGVYFVSVSAARHKTTQTSTEVKAGAAASLRVLLASDNSPVPYHDILHFQGHIDAYLSELSFAAELLAPGTLNCVCSWHVTPNAGMATLVFEANGQVSVPNPGTPVTKPGDAYWELVEDDGNGTIHSDYRDFPFSYHFENASFDKESTGKPFLARITGGAWPSGQMDYDLYITMFYIQPAPDAWSLLNGDT